VRQLGQGRREIGGGEGGYTKAEGGNGGQIGDGGDRIHIQNKQESRALLNRGRFFSECTETGTEGIQGVSDATAPFFKAARNIGVVAVIREGKRLPSRRRQTGRPREWRAFVVWRMGGGSGEKKNLRGSK